MASVFISHSSRDAAFSTDLAARLREAGYQSLFLDFDPADGIPAGRKWEQELYAALRACDVVVFLGTQASCASNWCFVEMALAGSLDRTVIGLMLEDSCSHPLIADSQIVRWHADPADGWTRLLDGLRKARLTPRDYFDWNSERAPYPGLESFSGEDAGVFFGRRDEIANLLQLLEPSIETRTRCIVVAGPSGSGKSSLVRAGLLPRLARRPDRWALLGPMTPGADPLGRLSRELARGEGGSSGKPKAWRPIESALRKTPRNLVERSHDVLMQSPARAGSLVLVIDQLEELATQSGERDRENFLRVLRVAVTEAGSPLFVVATVRSEFLTPLLASGALAGLSPHVVLVSPVDRGGVAEVIEGPAKRARLILEDGLAARMVEDSAGGDALPLLAYVLRQLYERAGDERRLRLSDYKALGGVEGAVRAQADRILDSLARRFTRERVLHTLLETVTVGFDYEPMRRRVKRSALGSEANEIIDAFISARLYRSDVESGEPVVEVTHETLLRTWPPLRDAVRGVQDELQLRGELDRAARDWERGKQRELYLWSGDRLAAARKYADSATSVSSSVRQFLAESALRDRATLERQSVLIANQALRDCAADPERAILLSIAAVEQYAPSPRAMLALSTAVSECRLRGRSSDETLLDAYISPDGKLLLTVHREEYYMSMFLRASVLASNSEIFTIDQGLDDIRDVGFSGDSRWVATGSSNGMATVWDAFTGEKRFSNKPVPASWSEGPGGKKEVLRWGEIRNVALSSNGGLLAFFRESDGRVEVFNTRTNKRLWSARVADRVGSLVFTPDDKYVLAGAFNGELLWFSARSGKVSKRMQPHTDAVESVAVSGNRTLTTSQDKTAVLSDDESQKRLLGHESDVNWGAFSKSGQRVFTASSDGTARCWDVEEGDQLFVLRPHPGEVKRILLPDAGPAVSVSKGQLLRWETDSYDELLVIRQDASTLAFAPDGSSLVTGDDSGTVRIWDIATGALSAAWPALSKTIENLTFSHDGSKLLVTLPSEAILYHWPSSRRIRTFRSSSAALSPDGQLVAMAGNRCTAVVVNAATGKSIVKLTQDDLDESDDDDLPPSRSLFSPDSSDIVTSSADRIAAVWDAASGENRFILEYGMEDPAWSLDGRCLGLCKGSVAHLCYDPPEGRTVILKGHESVLTSLAFSPDSTRVLTASYDATARVWDAQTGEMLRVIRGPRGAIVRAVFSPDGTLIATASDDGTVRIYKDIGLADWMALGRRRVFRELTEAERTQYGLTRS